MSAVCTTEREWSGAGCFAGLRWSLFRWSLTAPFPPSASPLSEVRFPTFAHRSASLSRLFCPSCSGSRFARTILYTRRLTADCLVSDHGMAVVMEDGQRSLGLEVVDGTVADNDDARLWSVALLLYTRSSRPHSRVGECGGCNGTVSRGGRECGRR